MTFIIMFNKDRNLQYDTSPHSPHTITLGLIRPDSFVLDVGCNQGYIGKKLIKYKNCHVDGIDIDEKLLKRAKKNGYKNTFKFDLYKDEFNVPKKYDYILFLDILEHLPNPHIILEKFVKKNLKSSGTIIISLPNIARWEIRLGLLLGKFNYAHSGILHEDHLRHFTLKTGSLLIQNSGLKVNNIIPTGLGHRLGFFQTLTAFQFIYVCQKR